MSPHLTRREAPLEFVVGALRAAGEPSRLRALALLSHGELAVGELAQALDQSQPRVSRHLKVLTEMGLAERAPEGAWVFYRLAAEGSFARAFVEALVAALDPRDAVLSRDQQRLQDVRAARAEIASQYFEANAGDWARLRALHLPEADIEAAILEAAGPGPFDFLVDVGSGQGRMLELFAERVRRAEGFDVSVRMLSIARAAIDRLGGAGFGVRQGDVYAPPFPPATADLVTVHQVLHFLPDPGRAVLEAARLLRPGGRIVVVDFAPHALEFLRSEHAHRRLGFADAEVLDWLASAGLEPDLPRTLAPSANGRTQLTVTIWAARRPALALEGQA
jgi:ArsR family transcriptional regulator